MEQNYQRLLKVSFVAALQSEEYMHIRSALVLLSKIADYFPSRSTTGKILLTHVEILEPDGKGREDIKIMARSVGAILRRRQASWIDEDSQKPKAKKPSSGAAAADTPASAPVVANGDGASGGSGKNQRAVPPPPSRPPNPPSTATPGTSPAPLPPQPPPRKIIASNKGEFTRSVYCFPVP